MKRWLLCLLITLFAVAAFAQTPPGGYGPGQAGTSAGGSWGTVTDANAVAGVVGNGKICFDGAVTSGSPNISSAGECTWTSADIGSFIFVTNICGGSSCGFGTINLSTTILPSTQITTAIISSITDSHHIVTSCSAPATCSSPNASATNSGHATVIYAPTKQAVPLNAAWTAAFANASGGCPTILLPKGIILFEAQIFTSLPANSCIPSSGYSSLQQALLINGGGPVVMGIGEDATLLVPTPDFNYTCTNNICIGPSGSSNSAITYERFTISGFGQSMHLSGLSETALVSCVVCTMDHVILSGWMNGVANTAGVFSSSGFSSIHHSQIQGFGGTTGCLNLQGDNNFLADSIVGNCAGPTVTAVGGNGTLTLTGNSFYAGNITNSAQIDTTGYSVFTSTNDRFFGTGQSTNTGASDDIKIANGTAATITNFYNQNSGSFDNGIEVFSGGTLKLTGYNSATGKNKGLTVDSGGTFFDGGDNTPSYGSTTNSCPGACFGSASFTGTVPVTGNFSLTNATFTSVTGTDPKDFTLNITASALSPVTIVYTYPTPGFLVTPSCSALDVGGSNPLLQFSISSGPSTAAVTFLSSTAATSTDTLQVKIVCH